MSAPATAMGDLRREGGYAWYVLFVLTFAYTIAFIDRQVLNLLVDPIKADLLLSDTRISLLQGFAFVAAYVACGPLFGRWVDNGHRRNILVFGVLAWSVFTVMCGMAEGYWSLFLARAGVGAAEASLTPAAWSLIADYFDRRRMARAMSVFYLAPYLGGGLALIAGGLVVGFAGELRLAIPLLADFAPWQIAFIVVGVPGALIALVLLTVREPPRRGAGASADRTFSLREVIGYLWHHRAFYARFLVGMSLLSIVTYGVPTWMPAFLIRHHGVPASQAGLQFGVIVLTLGSIGVFSGPWLERWLIRRGHRDAGVRCAIVACVGIVLCCIALPFVRYSGALGIGAVLTLLYSMPWAMAAAALQVVTPNRLRGVTASIYLFLISVFGLGVAPTAVAFITDNVFRDPARVGQSLALVCIVAALASGWMLVGLLPHYRAALDRADAAHA